MYVVVPKPMLIAASAVLKMLAYVNTLSMSVIRILQRIIRRKLFKHIEVTSGNQGENNIAL